VTSDELADLLAACDDPDVAAQLLADFGDEPPAPPRPRRSMADLWARPASDEPDTLSSLGDLIRSCQECRLCLGRKRAVPGEGPAPARLMIVGEGPGQEEDDSGRPFVGRAGRLLDRILRDVGIDRSQAFVTNAVKCRPPQNRTPEPEEVEACRLYLEAQIAAVDPDYILALGATALSVFAPQRRITYCRGVPFWWHARRILPTFHPSAALRDQDRERQLREDLAGFAELLRAAYGDGPLEEFEAGECLLRLRSPALKCTVAVCSTDREAGMALAEGLVPYTAAELRTIHRDGVLALRLIHQAKLGLLHDAKELLGARLGEATT
jgi:uracil-DNA glycosylase family 4